MGVNAAEALAADGYRFITSIEPATGDYDAQGHLNNAAIVRFFNDVRVAYVQQRVGTRWTDLLRSEAYVVAARELHVLYESEGLPGERFVGAMRYAYREGKASVLEQRIVEHATARPVARAWVVQLLVRDGRAVDWPELYFDLVAEVEGRPIERRRPRPRPPFGPPA